MSDLQSTRELYQLLTNGESLMRHVDLILRLIPKANINALVYNAQEGTFIFDDEPNRDDELRSLFHFFLKFHYVQSMLHSDWTAQQVERIHAEFLRNGAKLPNAYVCNHILRGWAERIEELEELLDGFKEAYKLYDTKCRKIATNTIQRYDAPHRYIDESLHTMYHPDGTLARNIWKNFQIDD